MNNKISLKNSHGHIRVIALIGVMILIGLSVGYRVFQSRQSARRHKQHTAYSKTIRQ